MKDLLCIIGIFFILLLIFIIFPYVIAYYKSVSGVAYKPNLDYQSDVKYTNDTATVSIDDICKHGQLGDILGLSTCDLHTLTLGIFTQSIWSHVALIFTDYQDGTKYVVELGVKGFRQTLLRNWLNYHSKNKANKIIWIARATSSATVDGSSNESKKMCKILNEFIKNKYELNDDYVQWALNKITQTCGSNNGEKMYCSEFVILILQHLGIVKKDTDITETKANAKHSSTYTPGEIVNRQFPLRDSSKFYYLQGKILSII